MRTSTGKTRKWLAQVVCLAMLLSLMTGGFAGTVAAKDTRAAIAVSVEGTVMVTKAGGSNEYRAYADMSLNQGDHIRTESGSSIVLRVVDQEDEVTVGPDTELYISSLMETDGAKKSKFKMWAGSVWFKVKKLVNADDEFELETSTAVMGVRGSNGYIQAKLGELFAMMASGVLATEKKSGSEDSTSSTASIYPGQQINLSGSSDIDPSEAVSGLDIDAFVANASPSVIQQLLTTIQQIREENEQFVQDVNTGSKQVDSKSGLQLGSPADLSKFGNNLTALLANVAKTAADTNKLDKTTVQSLIEKANQSTTGEKIDLNNVPKFDKTAGMDPEVAKKREETAKQQQTQSQQERDRAAKELEEKQKENVALLKLLEAAQKAFEEANRKAKEEAAKNAEDAFKNGLSDTQKQQFDQNKQKVEDEKKKQEEQQQNNTSSTSTPSTSPPPGTSDPGSSDPPPTAPAAPTDITVSKQTITTPSDNSVEIRAKGPVGAIVQLLLNGNVVYSQPVQGSNNGVQFTLSNLSNGTYAYQLRSFASDLTSAAVNVPTITVNIQRPSATAMLINNGAQYTYSNEVIVSFTGVQGNPVTVELSESQDFSGMTVRPYNPAGVSYTLPANTGTTDVTKQLYGRLVNADGNKSAVFWMNTIILKPPVAAKATFTVSPSGITLSSAFSIQSGQPFFVDIDLSNFTGDKALYAAEVHLNYDELVSMNYGVPDYVSPPTDGVFSGTHPLSMVSQSGVGEGDRELVYVISKYPTGGVPADNIVVEGTKRLVRFGLIATGDPYEDISEGSLYLTIMIVDKNGDPVNTSISATVYYTIENGGLS